MRYNLKHLDEMRHVPNIGMVIEQIDLAAKMATQFFRSYGIALPSPVPQGPPPTRLGPPMHEEVDTYLRFLVSDAYIGFSLSKQEAATEGAVAIFAKGGSPGIPDTDIEGLPEYDDPLFEVKITGLQDRPGFVTAQISLRLTG
jgi:hypothetical protein